MTSTTPGSDGSTLAVDVVEDVPTGVRATAARHPVGMVWFGVVLFALGPVLVADADISGTAFSFWRLWIGVGILGVAGAVHRRLTGATATGRGLAWAGACGVAFAVHQIMVMTAIQATSVVDVTLMNTVAPVVVGVLAVPLFGERPGARFRAWSAVAMAGTAVLAIAGSSGPSGDPSGMALAVGNVVFFALYFVGTKAARPHIATVPFLFWVVLAAAVSVSAWVAVTGEAVTPLGGADLGRVAFMALLPGALGHFAITWSLRWVPANLPPVIMLSIPVISGALAWVLLGQSIRAVQVVAGVATVAGVLGAVRSPSARALGANDPLTLAEPD